MWADLGGQAGRRPVCVLTRDAAIEVLSAVTCAPVTRTIRGIRSEVEVGSGEGLPATSVISCDNLITVPKSLLMSGQSDDSADRSEPNSTSRCATRSTSRSEQATRAVGRLPGTRVVGRGHWGGLVPLRHHIGVRTREIPVSG